MSRPAGRPGARRSPAGQGDAALSWEGLRAEWIGTGLDFEYWLGVQQSPLFANTFVVRAADLEDPDKKAFLDKYLRAWSMGLEFGYQNPTRRRRSGVRAVPDPGHQYRAGARHHLDPAADQRRSAATWTSARAGATMTWRAWQIFFDKIYELKQITKPIKAEDVCTNDCIGPANDFDHAKVKADADAYKLSDAFAAIDVENVKAHLYDQAVKG